MSKTINTLQELLATLTVSQANAKAYHWLVTGKEFFELHQKYEELYQFLALKADEVAERILALGERPLIGLANYLELSKVSQTSGYTSDEAITKEIIETNLTIIAICNNVKAACQEDSDDETEDQMIAIVFQLQKVNWMYQAYLKRL